MVKKNKIPVKNEFFDISPIKNWSILWFPISMSNVNTKQSVKKCMEWIDFFVQKKADEPKLGLNVTYTDFLYMVSKEPSNEVKEKFMRQIIEHKNGLKKLIYKNRKKNQILHAFHFEAWANLYLEVEGDFNEYFRKIKAVYTKDKIFQKYIKEDCKFYRKGLTEIQLNFFLEEHLMTYLILNKKLKFRNEYIQGRERDILMCYPGVPPKAQVYLFQLNPFNFSANNKFIGQYDLENKKFYNFNNFDLESWDYR